MHKLFFIIPVYKVEDLLHRCVNSVIAQTYKNTEIILVDDGSPDKCGEICDNYAQKHENVKVIHKANGGLSDARNAGLRHIVTYADKEDFLTFLDSDDFVSPSFGEIMVNLCIAHNADTAQCGYEKGSKDTFSPIQASGKSFCTSSDEALLGYNLKSVAWAKIYKMKTFEGLFFPVGMFNEDEFVTYRAVAESNKVAFCNDKLYYYYQRPSSIMQEIAGKIKNNPHKYDYLKAYDERIAYFEKAEKPDQVLKTREKICTDIILRYCEQMYVKKDIRDEDSYNGTYMKIYRENYKLMIKRKGIPPKRKLMYRVFNICPKSAVLMGRIFTLRK